MHFLAIFSAIDMYCRPGGAASYLLRVDCVGVKRIEDLVAFQLAVDFKREVYRVVNANERARADFKYRNQLFDAASSVEANVAEGWYRYQAGEFIQFLKYARASTEETKRWLHDGVDRGYFDEAQCSSALLLGDRCGAALMNLLRSLLPFARKRRGP